MRRDAGRRRFTIGLDGIQLTLAEVKFVQVGTQSRDLGLLESLPDLREVLAMTLEQFGNVLRTEVSGGSQVASAFDLIDSRAYGAEFVSLR